jgi:hypothetical protein
MGQNCPRYVYHNLPDSRWSTIDLFLGLLPIFLGLITLLPQVPLEASYLIHKRLDEG